jgi:hypothetical protein
MTSVLLGAVEEIMKTALLTPSFRAMAIADGLIRSGRASHPTAVPGFIRLASGSALTNDSIGLAGRVCRNENRC